MTRPRPAILAERDFKRDAHRARALHPEPLFLDDADEEVCGPLPDPRWAAAPENPPTPIAYDPERGVYIFAEHELVRRIRERLR